VAYSRLLERSGRLSGDLNRLQIRILANLARRDEESSEREREERLKDLLLVFDRDTFNEIYDEDGNLKVKEEDIEWEVPQSEADVAAMMDELKQMGVRL
jgi:hypothetical protein